MSREPPEQEAPLLAAEGRDDDHSPARSLPATRQARERLLDAALELFAERGFEATTTKLIAGRAGVPNGLIYYYFETKEKLLECLLAERTFLPDLQARVTEARANRDADPRLTLIEICTEFHAALRRNEPFARIISREAHLRPVASNLVRQLADQAFTLIETFLEDAEQQGKLRPLDTEMVARALFSSLLMGALLWEFDSPRRSIERLVDVLLGGTG
jgi:TetR/AcrR family transcriptional regulator, cholesterol catabolism regulator